MLRPFYNLILNFKTIPVLSSYRTSHSSQHPITIPSFRKRYDDRLKLYIAESTRNFLERNERARAKESNTITIFESKEHFPISGIFLLSFTGFSFLYLYNKFRT